ncbi:MAG: glycosyltransferase [Planctomycetales bacterium]|nr:glycosyltransferase [Planctomycetales bacterium]
MTGLKVSIITICYNSAATIRESIESVLAQDYTNIEYTIVDGQSTDATCDIVRSYGDAINVFKSESDTGIYNAMNKGIALATGDVVAFLNSDDVYRDCTVVGRMADLMQRDHLDAAYGDIYYVDRANIQRVIRYWRTGEFGEGAIGRGWIPPHPSFFCRRDVYMRLGTYNEEFRIAADYELMLRYIAVHRVRIGYLPYVVVNMRVGGESHRLKGFLKGNREILRSFQTNKLPLPRFFIVRRMMAKLKQFLVRERVGT